MAFCPKCGKLAADTDIFCSACQTQIKPKTTLAPNAEEAEMAVVYGEASQSVQPQAAKASGIGSGGVKQKIMPFLQKYRTPIFIALLVIAGLCLLGAVLMVLSKTHLSYARLYSEYMSKYKQARAAAKGYSASSTLGKGYKQIADNWKKLANSMFIRLWFIRIRAIVLSLISAASGFGAYISFTLGKNK